MTHFQRCFLIISSLFALSSIDASAQYWEKVTTIPPAYQESYWLDVFFLPANPNFGWICGYNGHVIRTTDGGANWSGATVPFDPRSGGTRAGHLEHVSFVNQSVGYTSGPTGIFRTVDGGATWKEVTPDQAAELWGCYFLTPEYGVVLGGNCGTQDFFYTRDSGTTWTRFQLTSATTKLSDAILYPNGYGLASGSGRIFETLDSGKTWALFENTGSNIWQEEIAARGQSILVPTAGSTCEGIGSNGGMRFYDGDEWRNFQVSSPMFGSFLTSESSGWVCGYNRAVYYTSDDGKTWELKNCGITGSLDDMWFLNSTTGWAVGGNAFYNGSFSYTTGDVYKYAASRRLLSKPILNFGDVCTPVNDTSWVINKSMLPVSMRWTLSGDSEFTVLAPDTSFVTIPACDSVRFIIRTIPKTVGDKSATVTITFPEYSGDQPLLLRLRAISKKQESAQLSDTITINKAEVGKQTTASVYFANSGINPSTISSVEPVYGSNNIMVAPFTPPFIIPEQTPKDAPAPLNFIVTPSDTGWIETKFTIFLKEPCPLDTSVLIRAYGISPIINAPRERIYSTACAPEKFDTIPVTNTGNAPLIITSADITGSSYFSVVGWLRNSQSYPRIIQPGSSDTLILLFKATSGGAETAALSLINNDSTRINGKKNPYTVQLNAGSLRPQVSDFKTVDLGRVCVREEARRSFYIANTGDLDAVITDMQFDGVNFKIDAGTKVIRAKDSLLVTVTFRPSQSGIAGDDLIILTEPCAGRTVVKLDATSIETRLAFIPEEIFKEIRTGQKTVEQIAVVSTGTTAANIVSIKLDPNTRSDVRLLNLPSPMPVLQLSDTIKFAIEFNPATDTTFDGKILIETSPDCYAFFQLKYFVRSTSTRLLFSKTELSFTDEICVPDSSYDTLSFKNDSDIPVNVLSVTPPNANYTVVSPQNIPFTVDGGETEQIIIRYSFKTPSANDMLTITTDEPGASTRTFPLKIKTVETIRPQLAFKNLDLGNFRLDSSGAGTVEIHNSSGYVQTITNIFTEPAITGFNIVLPAFSFDLLPDQRITIPIQFTATAIDTVSAVLKVASGISCLDTGLISIIARVPDKQYPFTISIDDYTTEAPDTLDVPVIIENSFVDAQVSLISLKIRFNEELAYPLGVISEESRDLPFTFANGELDISLDRNSMTKPLGSQGKLFIMQMLVMPRAPNVTIMDIDTILVESRYNTIPTIKDGSVTVGYCPPIRGINIGPTFKTMLLFNGSENVQCEITSTGEQTITFEMVDIYGNQQLTYKENFKSGNFLTTIPANNLPSGIYFLQMRSSSGAAERLKVSIVK